LRCRRKPPRLENATEKESRDPTVLPDILRPINPLGYSRARRAIAARHAESSLSNLDRRSDPLLPRPLSLSLSLSLWRRDLPFYERALLCMLAMNLTSRSALRPPSARTRRSRWLAGSRVKGEKGADLSKRRRRKREKIGCLGRRRRCERKACVRADLDETGGTGGRNMMEY